MHLPRVVEVEDEHVLLNRFFPLRLHFYTLFGAAESNPRLFTSVVSFRSGEGGKQTKRKQQQQPKTAGLTPVIMRHFQETLPSPRGRLKVKTQSEKCTASQKTR